MANPAFLSNRLWPERTERESDGVEWGQGDESIPSRGRKLRPLAFVQLEGHERFRIYVYPRVKQFTIGCERVIGSGHLQSGKGAAI